MSPNKGDNSRSRISQVVSHTRSQIILTCLRVPTSVPVIAVLMTKSGAVLTQKPSTCESSFASGFDVDANSAMWKSPTDRRVSVATTYPAMPRSCHSGSLASRHRHKAKGISPNPSLRMSGHGSSMNRTFIVEDCAEDEFGHWATDEVTGEQGHIDE